MLIIFMNVDVLEKIYSLSRAYEDFELDEIIPLGATLATSLLIFIYRRMDELGEITQAFEHLSMRDPLTHLKNRRAGQLDLQTWHKQASLESKSFSIIQLNIDNFKRVNELYGYIIGDEVLRSVANCIKQELPEEAELIRWLDDTFMILIKDSSHYSLDLANTLKKKVSEKHFATTDPITCSIGIVSWLPKSSLSDMLHNVEESLQDAKDFGKDQVNIYKS